MCMFKGCNVDIDIHILDYVFSVSVVFDFVDYFPLYIEPLVSQCMEWCDSYNHPIIVPLTTWLDNIHTPFVTSVTNLSSTTSAELLPNGQHVLVGSANRVQMYHIASKRMVKSFQGTLLSSLVSHFCH